MASSPAHPLFSLDAPLLSNCEVSRPYDIPFGVFLGLVADGGLRYLRHEQASVSEGAEALGGLGRVEISRYHYGRQVLVLRLEEGAALLDFGDSTATVEVAGRAPADVDAAVGRILKRLNVVKVASDEAPVSFWAATERGSLCEHRRIKAPAWEELTGNHAPATVSAISELMRAREPGDGRLLLWHGPPGTGKTYAIRALAREWSDWCSVHFITDPEKFLGESTSYLLNVLTAGDMEPDRELEWQLLVLEDAGELLTADARERTGQALSRLLNVTDGLLGQGLNALVLVTTNEPLRKLHPAIQRPGRCWTRIEFGPLAAEEANQWLAERGSKRRVEQPMTLADLYALLAGREVEVERPIGFADAA